MMRHDAPAVGGDVFDLIRSDHEAVRDLFKRMEETSDRAGKARAALFAALADELLAHSRAEQEVFYQALAERAPERTLLLEAVEEHGVVERAVADLETCPTEDERWLAKLTVLKELVEHHVEEEESEIFRLARKLLSREEALELGAAMQERKDGAI
jgi:hemerythrin-like domain-containing protein